ncbi:uncharacterized protein SCHCODRAFT_02604399 [Schizophyllum commune H4-8]|uniref:uncharacterized protein n=1 Tax=Schizophyllum commune (strain H4-8 / FGSC 9210) TaxID=578458 RepID=UPI00215FA6DD|nr:uncharacterized protein SCHCODRAFT_02604399 [Schizophyllum commune H4-8]KAI5899178.1 hypothetical protein SCHCODRAFT_02604399 [Schizophyllum commune H4-8]
MPARLSMLAVCGLAFAFGTIPTYTSATSTNPTLPAGFAPLRVGFDPIYDTPTTPMTAVACSDGARGLIPLGFPTFASLPSFPFVGAVFAVAAWNSSACATCWELRYECAAGAKEWPKAPGQDASAQDEVVGDTKGADAGSTAQLDDSGATVDEPQSGFATTTTSAKPSSRRIFFLAIDHADAPAPDTMTGIDEVVFASLEEATLSKTAMNELTCGHGVQLGVVQAAYRQVNIAMCGL